MKKNILSCLTAAAIVLALAFSASAVCSRTFSLDVIPPQGDGFSFDGSGSETTDPSQQSDSQQIERIDITDELMSILAQESESASEEETMALYSAAQTAENGGQTETSLVKPILICAVIGLVIALIVVLAVKSSYKPVHRKHDATEYLVDGSLNVTVSTEKLVRTDVSERTIETKQSNT